MPEARSNSSTRFARFAWFVLVFNLAVVLWGAYVRATGSGAGCGNHWPLCNAIVESPSPAAATLIEFTHRATGAIDGVFVALLLVWAFRAFPRCHPARLGAALSALFLIAEALLGRDLALFRPVAGKLPPSLALLLSVHLVNTLTLLACLTLTAIWGGGQPATRPRGKEAKLAIAALASFLLLGVSGAIAALGDTLFPVHSLAEGFSQDLSSTANIFLRLRMWHPVLAGVVGLWLAGYGIFAVSRRKDAQLIAGVMMLFIGIQLACGLVNLVLLAPVSMQLIHLLTGDLLWIFLVLLCARMAATPKA